MAQARLSGDRPEGFSISMRGYERDEVDARVAALQARIEELEAELAAARGSDPGSMRELGGRLGRLLQHAHDTAQRVRAQAEADAERARTRARETAERVVSEARADARALLEAARAEADALVRDARLRVEELAETERFARSRIAALRRKLGALAEQLAEESAEALPPVAAELEPAPAGETPGETPGEEAPTDAGEGGER